MKKIITRKMSAPAKRKNLESSVVKKVKQTTLIPVNLPPKDGGTGVFTGDSISIACWNVNGIRACIQKPGFQAFKSISSLDILCFNETKLQDSHVTTIKSQLPEFPYQYWSCSRTKLGYSGTAILSKTQPISWAEGLKGHPEEGRLTLAEFDTFFVVCTYVPNSGSDRFDYRLNNWDPDLRSFISDLHSRGKEVIWLGDLNVINLDIDIHRLKGNEKCAGATPEERKSFHSTLITGLFDSFRFKYPDRVQYSWYSAISKTSREKKQGWRIDMAVVTQGMTGRIVDSIIHDDVMGSDHHPIELVIKNK